VRVQFVGVRALDDVDLELARGEILGLIGPNGAGKTTLVNTLSGYQRPDAGVVRLGGTVVTRWSPDRLARAGLARTFQNVRLFPNLTVFENVRLGTSTMGVRAKEATRLAWELLARLGLDARAALRASSLPHGEERRVGIARALATRPAFVLLDEPAAGLNETESDELLQALADIPAQYGCGLMVIEHDMRLIMRLCERIQVIDYGKTLASGTPAQVRADPSVIAAYLGSSTRADDAER
jgi:branched-chain amino acid transport system ATP-binding protein